MGNIFRFLLVLPCITLLLYSCESEIENEIQSSTEKLNLSGLESDSLQLESYELSEMTDELKALKERIDELKKAKTRSVASSNYSQYFSENMWAIRELPFTLSTGGGYLSCTGWGQRVTYEGYNPGSYGKFYVQILLFAQHILKFLQFLKAILKCCFLVLKYFYQLVLVFQQNK